MADRTNLVAVTIGRYQFTAAWYPGTARVNARAWPFCYVGVRKLGPARYALDIGKLALLFERYWKAGND